jgi:hypothetical protein
MLWSQGLTLWFWSSGFRPLQAPGCATYVCFFANVPAFTWFRTVGLVSVVLWWLGLAVFVLMCVKGCIKPLPPNNPAISLVNACGNLVYLAMFVVFTELALAWNNLSGVNNLAGSTGQVLACTLGVFNLSDTIFSNKDESTVVPRMSAQPDSSLRAEPPRLPPPSQPAPALLSPARPGPRLASRPSAPACPKPDVLTSPSIEPARHPQTSEADLTDLPLFLRPDKHTHTLCSLDAPIVVVSRTSARPDTSPGVEPARPPSSARPTPARVPPVLFSPL